jgi:hypothetical protein
MKISNVASTDTRGIQLFEFLTPDGFTITSFFSSCGKTQYQPWMR